MPRKTLLISLLLVTALCTVSFAAGQQEAAGTERPSAVSLATMPAGTSTYAVGAALATVWNKYLDFTVTQQPMQVTGPAFRLLKRGELDIAITTVWAIHGAYTGEDPFWDIWKMEEFAPVPITQVNTGSAIRYGFFTTDPTVKSIKDLEGKRVYITQPGAESDIQVKALLKAAGADYDKIIDVKFSQISEAQQGLKEGRAVALYWTASPWIQDVSRTHPLHVVPISAAEVDKLNELLPGWGFSYASLNDGDFGLKAGGDCLAVPFGIYAREGVPEDVIYDLVKNMYERHDELMDVNAQYLGLWTLDRALLGIGAPIHPGAIRYYKEAGVWTDKIDQQNEAIKQMNRRSP